MVAQILYKEHRYSLSLIKLSSKQGVSDIPFDRYALNITDCSLTHAVKRALSGVRVVPARTHTPHSSTGSAPLETNAQKQMSVISICRTEETDPAPNTLKAPEPKVAGIWTGKSTKTSQHNPPDENAHCASTSHANPQSPILKEAATAAPSWKKPFLRKQKVALTDASRPGFA